MNSSAPSSGVLASPCSAVTQNTDMTLANRGHVDGEGAKRTEGRQQRLPVPVAPEEDPLGADLPGALARGAAAQHCQRGGGGRGGGGYVNWWCSFHQLMMGDCDRCSL
mmetsp:Transcript_99152/g.276103  ORF Transcript_99152/g.276103 Transcript_99152/m.276103 type:complete len:108 (+) Transcript_99152:2-325(+)